MPDARLPLWPIVGTGLLVAAALVLADVADAIADLAGLTLAAVALAWLIHPLHRAVGRRVGRGVSLVVIVLGMLAVGGVLGGFLLADLDEGATGLSDRIRDAVGSGGSRSLIDRLQVSLHVGDGVANWLSSLPSTLVLDADGTPAIGRRVADLLVVVVLAAFFLASSATIVNSAVALWPSDERDRVWGLLADVEGRAGTHLRQVVVQALVGTGVAAAVLALTGLPLPVALGTWVGFWLTVPTIGWAIGLVPVAVVAAFARPAPGGAAVAGIVALVIVSMWLRRRRGAPSIRAGIGVTVTALAVGVAISGTGTAILCYVVAIVAVAVVTSEHHVRLPMPPVGDDAVRIGPIVLPRGLRGWVVALVAVAVGVVLWSIVGRAASAIVWITLAGLLAIAIDRPVRALQRRTRMPHGAAVGVTFALIGAVTAAMVASAVSEGPTSAARALQRVPDVVEQLEDAPLVGGWLRDHDAANAVADQLEQLPRRLSQSEGALSWFPSIGSQLVDVMWALLLTVALALDGGRVVRAVERRVPATHRRQFTRVTGAAHRALAGYAVGAVLVSTMNGAVVLVLALALQIGLAPVLALWAFLWDFIPQIGGFIGGVPLVVLALVAGPSAFVIATVIYAVYQIVESNVIFPAVIGDSVDIPAWATMLAALAGAAAGGVVGAVVLTPLVGVVRLMFVEQRRADFPGRTVAVTTGDDRPTAAPRRRTPG